MWVDELRVFLIEHGVYEEFISVDCPEWFSQTSSIRYVLDDCVDWVKQKSTDWGLLNGEWHTNNRESNEIIGMTHAELLKALAIDTKITKIFKGIRKLRPLH